jgi:hypothetical protein
VQIQMHHGRFMHATRITSPASCALDIEFPAFAILEQPC